MRLPRRWYWPFATGDAGIDVVELKAVAGLASGDRIVDFTTGDHHLVARTAKGRIYTSPVDLWANRWGQLGTRHVIAGGNRLELIPFGFGPGDPHPHEQPGFQGLSASYSIPSWWLDTPFAGKGKPVLLMRDPNTGSAPGESEKEREARFSEHLYPFEAMKDLDVVEVACGARHSLARLRDGRVVGWGANEHGCVGTLELWRLGVTPAQTARVGTDVQLSRLTRTRRDSPLPSL